MSPAGPGVSAPELLSACSVGGSLPFTNKQYGAGALFSAIGSQNEVSEFSLSSLTCHTRTVYEVKCS